VGNTKKLGVGLYRPSRGKESYWGGMHKKLQEIGGKWCKRCLGGGGGKKKRAKE